MKSRIDLRPPVAGALELGRYLAMMSVLRQAWWAPIAGLMAAVQLVDAPILSAHPHNGAVA
jgi:hypothetical protein